MIDINTLEKVNHKIICGVYFLYNNDILCYIGKSKDIQARISVHKGKIFTHYSFIECNEDSLSQLEKEMILKYSPTLNKVYNNQNVKSIKKKKVVFAKRHVGRDLWVITFKDGSETRYYSTLTALCTMNKATIGISKFTLDRHDFDVKEFSNSKCTIKKTVMQNTKQALKSTSAVA